LEGQPAPEVQDIVAWKNSDPVELSMFEGKYVLLEFWGSWCGPCLRLMPELIELHEQHADNGLVIIGIHIDSGEGIDTAAELDDKLQSVRTELWGGKDIPFPIAFVRDQKVTGSSRNDDDARTPLSAAYGIVGYPTSVLIDREGRIVKSLRLNNPKHREMLEARLTEQ